MFVERSIPTSKAWLSLSTAAACKVYLLLLSRRKFEKSKGKAGRNRSKYVNTNNGEILMPYRHAEQFGVTAGQFRRAIDELCQKGFIDIDPGSGLLGDPSRYSISDRWRLYGTPEFVTKERQKRGQAMGFAKPRKRKSQHASMHAMQHASMHAMRKSNPDFSSKNEVAK